MHASREFIEAAGLISYGPNFRDLYRREYILYLVEGEVVVPNRLRYIDISVQCEARAAAFDREQEL
jgi:hypothetical protein